MAAGEVISQAPAAGTEVALGSAVELCQSAWASRQVAVPDLSGAAADAEQTLADARLTVGDVERGLQRQRGRR